MLILFHFNGGLGDACHILPILFALHEKKPLFKIEISFATQSAKSFVQLFFPETKGIVTSDLDSIKKKFIQILKLRKKKFDFVFSGGHLNSSKTAIITLLINPKKSIGIRSEKYSFLYDIVLPTPDSKNFYIRYELLFAHLGLNHSDIEYGEKQFRKELKKVAKIHNPTRFWKSTESLQIAFANGADTTVRGKWNPSLKKIPENTVLDIFQKLKCDRRIKLILLGIKDDPFSYRIISDPNVLDMRGTTLQGLISILNQIDLLICNDSGILHLAHYCGTSYIGIFGPTDSEQYAPSKASSNIIQARGSCSKCYPNPICSKNFCELLGSLDVDKIVAHAKKILQQQVTWDRIVKITNLMLCGQRDI